jgi:hypothetical protein
MKKSILLVSMLALLIPGAAFAGSASDAALGLGAFAVFNQILSGTGIFGAVVPAPRPVVLPTPPPPVAVPVVVQPHYYPVYLPPPAVVYRTPVHHRVVYHAPARVVVIEKRVAVPGRGSVPPGHARHGRDWR